MQIPNYLNEAIERHFDEGMLRQIILRTPSGQFWDNLSITQQDEWREVITSLGGKPEDYLAHMKRMQPEIPERRP